MRNKTLFAFALFSISLAAVHARDVDRWSAPFSGGSNVVALWEFKPTMEREDGSGKKHVLKLRGKSKFVDQGVFGGRCLESFPTNGKQATGAVTPLKPDLSPAGPFTVECWFKLKKEAETAKIAVLVDCKNVFTYSSDVPRNNKGYAFYLKKKSTGKWRLYVCLGFGKDSVVYNSRDIQMKLDVWNYTSFTYNGKGFCTLFFNGKEIGFDLRTGRGSVVGSVNQLAIGGRISSTFFGFPGYIGQVRISKGIPAYLATPIKIRQSRKRNRNVFVRMEQNAAMEIVVFNNSGAPLERLKIEYSAFKATSKLLQLPDIPKGECVRARLPLDTNLKPGAYDLKSRVSGALNGQSVSAELTMPITIVPRSAPHSLPVINWGTGDLSNLKKIGFSYTMLGLGLDAKKVLREGSTADYSKNFYESRKRLDTLLANRIYGIGRLNLYALKKLLGKEYTKIDRDGHPCRHSGLCANSPRVLKFASDLGEIASIGYGDHPGLESVLVNDEIRDSSAISFNTWDKATYKKLSKQCQTALADRKLTKRGINYSMIDDFPLNRIIKDSNPYYLALKWWWTNGAGWNQANSAIAKGLRNGMHPGFWSFSAPVIRHPSLWGSGGDVDVLCSWTYSYPDPLKVGEATDELFAMAEGTGKKVLGMTQLIWYRNQTAPSLPKDLTKRTKWEREIPNARFITIAPDHLRESFWCMISRPVCGLVFHGWKSLVDAKHLKGAYRFTNPKTAVVLRRLVENVVKPFGPMLVQVPDGRQDVALLESFTSQMFAKRGTWGWSLSWEADMHLILQWGGFQPKIIYEESILRNGLDEYKILAMPYCDVLPESVYRKILAFQRRGGIVIADPYVAPAIVPDIEVPLYKRIRKPFEDKTKLQKIASDIRSQLKGVYQRRFDSSNPNVVVRIRQYGNAEYFFAVNDNRVFGDYVGQHGLVLEKGIASSARLSLRRRKGVVYDLLARKQTPANYEDGYLTWNASLGPCEGKMYLVIDNPIGKIKIDSNHAFSNGGKIDFKVTVLDTTGNPIQAIMPLKIRVLDSNGCETERSGCYGAENGILKLKIDVSPNDVKGEWKISVLDLASGIETGKTFQVR